MKRQADAYDEYHGYFLMPPCDEPFDWYAAQTSEEFHALEHPKPKYIWDEWSEPDSDKVNSDTFPMLANRWDVPQVRGE